MRPITLTMCGFGPYAQKAEISFDIFRERGIFLISGETGAGKTTIFDGICYALYGTASGRYKNKKNFRSEYISDVDESYVEFSFMHQGKKYVIKRYPGFVRKKQRGTGFIEVQERVELYEEDGTVFEKVKQANERIVRILGVDEDKFKQIAMIAQGEFWEVLNADTDKRTDIFRTLFKTHGYKNIEENLKRRLDNYQNDIEKMKNSIIQSFAEVSVSNESIYMERYDMLKDRASKPVCVSDLEEFIVLINQIISEDKIKEREIKEKYSEKENNLEKTKIKILQAEKTNALLEKLDNLNNEKKSLDEKAEYFSIIKEDIYIKKKVLTGIKPIYDNWTEVRKDYEKNENDIKKKNEKLKTDNDEYIKISEEYTNAKKRSGEGEKLKNNILKIEDEIKKYSDRENLFKNITIIRKEKDDLEKRKIDFIKKEQEIKNEITELKQKTGNIKDVLDKLNEKRDLAEKLSLLKKRAQELILNDIPGWTKSKKELKKKQTEFENVLHQYDDAENRRLKAERSLELCRAGIMAESLQKGIPCPVCGSIEHPMPAKLPENIISENDYNVLKDNAVKLEKKKNKLLTETEKIKSVCDENEKYLRKDILEIVNNQLLKSSTKVEEKDMDKLIKLLSEKNDFIGLYSTDILHEADDLESVYMELSEDEKKMNMLLDKGADGIREKIGENEEKIHLKSIELAKYETEFASLKNLTYDNKTQALDAKKNMEKAVDEIFNRIDNFTKALNDKEKEIVTIKAEISGLEERNKYLKKKSDSVFSELENECLSVGFKDVEEVKKYMVSEEDITKLENSLNEYNEKKLTNKIGLDELHVQTEGKTYINIKELNEEKKELERITKQLSRYSAEKEYNIKSNMQKVKNIESNLENFKTVENKKNVCTKLYNLVHGKTGIRKITLEQYVQAAGFESVIHAANLRLSVMSEGRYEMFRKKEETGKRSKEFLDLEVLDNYTGKSRPVGNLSGGESFKASLSLALGLSDLISANRGGIQMEALFIDEGFGTLDKKSMENAMEVLAGLTKSDKLVGIISHREELMENIPNQIFVKKSIKGSKLEILTA